MAAILPNKFCDICGEQVATLAIDESSGLQIGPCCADELVLARILIECAILIGGPRHPGPLEISKEDDR